MITRLRKNNVLVDYDNYMISVFMISLLLFLSLQSLLYGRDDDDDDDDDDGIRLYV